MKLGVVYCSYGVNDLLEKSLTPWIKAKSRHDISIAAVSTQFKEYAEMNTDVDMITGPILHNKLKTKDIDYVYVGQYEGFLEQEHVVRDYALQYLLHESCDYILLVDGDEVYTDQEINDLISYISRNPLIPWFRIEFKNLTFSESTYTTGFKPPRVFKVNVGEYKLNRFIWDNDVSYVSEQAKQEISYQSLASVTVPIKFCHPLHYTWLSNIRSKNKVQYQLRHFPGSGCSYKWNEQEDKLEFDYDFYKRTGQQVPELIQINE